MPSWSSSSSFPYLGVKLVTYFPQNSTLELPGVHGSYVLFDSRTGQTLASMDGTELTLWRTSCVSVFIDNEMALEEAGELVGAFERGVIGKGEIGASPWGLAYIYWNLEVAEVVVSWMVLYYSTCFLVHIIICIF
ncbi:unnamed protein product, partial [Vitis vinifera]